jgi:negative regulator of flagellin synthesis FlgM
MSVKYIGPGGVGQIGNLQKSADTQGIKKGKEAGEDKVEFSNVLQDVNKANSVSEMQQADRAEKVAALKAQIENGSYQPDLHKVSSSLLQFLVEHE